MIIGVYSSNSSSINIPVGFEGINSIPNGVLVNLNGFHLILGLILSGF